MAGIIETVTGGTRGGGRSFLLEDAPPSAILSNGLLTIPLYAVSTLTINESYVTPATADSVLRTLAGTHTDTISLSGLLLGEERFRYKFELETLAETSRMLQASFGPGGLLGSVVLITSMTVRTDLQVQSLTFTASATRRQVIDVSLTLVQLDKRGMSGKLIEAASFAVGALADFTGGG